MHISFPSPTSAASFSLFDGVRGIESMIKDGAFQEIKEFYYDVSQYDWVKRNYSTDFGKVFFHTPHGVFKPKAQEHLLTLIELANIYGVNLNCRGQGHSVDGKTLEALDGIVIDLRDLPRDFKFVHYDNQNALIVSGPATWKEVLDFTLQHRSTLPVLTDYLGLSLGGILNIGGLGGSSYKNGSLADNVLTLDILTFNGQILSCSKTENKELFRAALCSLGQIGIILNATLSLVESKEYVDSRLLYYRNSTQFLKDQYAIYSKGQVDHLKGSFTNLNGEFYYVIEAATFHDKISEDALSEIFADLSPDKTLKKESTYVDFVNEVNKFVELLEKAGKWDVPHPWYGVLLPQDQVAEHLKLALKSPFLTGSEPVIISPINTETLHQPFFIRPQGKTIYLLSLLYNCDFLADPHLNATKVTEYNKALYRDAIKRGGCSYPPRALPSLHDWELHFGKVWPTFCEMKAKYDPNGLRSLNIAE
jgi:cytokinin dehydrogenase